MNHEVVLRSPDFVGVSSAPALLERSDQKIMEAVYRELSEASQRSKLRATIARRRGDDGLLRLFQPSHRAFPVVVWEAACDQLGDPKLDRKKIESAGIVVRRLVKNAAGREIEQGWMTNSDGVRGWFDLQGALAEDDPNPARRRHPSTGNPHLDAQLEALRKPLSEMAEKVTAAFVAPPKVCDAADRTVLLGIVPLASTEFSDRPISDGFDAAELEKRLSPYLKDLAKVIPTVPAAGYRLGQKAASQSSVQGYLRFLQQLVFEFDLFGTNPGSRGLYRQLEALKVEYRDGTKRSAVAHIQEAADTLMFGKRESVEMPLKWADVSKVQARRILAAARKARQGRLQQLAGGAGRFDDREATYRIRTFVRIRRDDGCPPVLMWAAPSERFRIDPWFENGPLPPPIVQLPDIRSDSIGKYKPNVTMQMPGSLMDFLNKNNFEDLQEGKGSEGSSSGPEWLCGFNIPIITFCALILLFIMVYILNFIFWWIPYVRICIPYPKGGLKF